MPLLSMSIAETGGLKAGMTATDCGGYTTRAAVGVKGTGQMAAVRFNTVVCVDGHPRNRVRVAVPILAGRLLSRSVPVQGLPE